MKTLRSHLLLFSLLLWAAIPAPTSAQSTEGEITFTQCLAVGPISRGGRAALHRDPLEAQLVTRTWSPPTAGESVPGTTGASGTWKALSVDKEGWFSSSAFTGGYGYASIDLSAPKVMILEAVGHSLVYVNGVLRTGDPYSYGYVHLPVQLREGRNDFLFLVGRERFRAKLTPAPSSSFLDTADPTLPDLVRGVQARTWGAVIAVNATEKTVSGLEIEAHGPGLRTIRTPLPPLPPLSTRKVGFRIEGKAEEGAKECKVELHLLKTSSRPVSVALRVREPKQTRKITFQSGIDGSVQYYALNPAQVGKTASGEKPSLILSLHGASVEAIGQADAYASKTWAHLVCPTNRRPYGFDWEDWGRQDALEVLGLAKQSLSYDPYRIYLTGHSMGGHGTWSLGVTFPGLFAAIGPSAGWVSFYSYAGGRKIQNPSPVEEILQRASASSDTLTMANNYAAEGIYILHGDADNNVPPTEARSMNTLLASFHHDYAYHEQPGAGHWWSNSDEPGAQCVDWPPMFDMFARRSLPENDSVRQVDFTTVNPGVSSTFRWLTIMAQQQFLKPSTVKLRFDPNLRRFSGTTANVARMSLDLSILLPDKPVQVEIDGQKLTEIPYPALNPSNKMPSLLLERIGETWRVASVMPPGQKTSTRSGPFKMAFGSRMLFVYGTRGNADENAWALAKARYDAETFWYRGNGSVDVIPDTAFDASRDRNRSVILFGNAETNAAWGALISDSPVQITRGQAQIGKKIYSGDDLACVFLRPRPGSDTSYVGVVSGTGMIGMRVAERLPYFLSGAGFPDCLLLGADSLQNGAAGVRTAGFFGNDWGVETGDFAGP